MISFDFETEPLPIHELEPLMPKFDDSAFEPSEFDPDTVKIGNLKDKGKIEAKIEDARAKHQEQQRTLATRRDAAYQAHLDAFRAEAAKFPHFGRILVAGYYSPEKDLFLWDDGDGGDESTILANFWAEFERCANAKRPMVGQNIIGFDLPFAVIRSWKLGVELPDRRPFTWWKRRIDWHEIFVDTMILFQLGRWGAKGQADFSALASVFGTAGKHEGIDGGQFAELYHSDQPGDRERAIEYLRQDVMQPARWAELMGV